MSATETEQAYQDEAQLDAGQALTQASDEAPRYGIGADVRVSMNVRSMDNAEDMIDALGRLVLWILAPGAPEGLRADVTLRKGPYYDAADDPFAGD